VSTMELIVKVGNLLRDAGVDETQLRRIGAVLLLSGSKAPEHAVNSLRKTAREMGHTFEEDK